MFSEDLNKEESALQNPQGRVCQAEGTVSTSTLKWACALLLGEQR